jgi:hypothetical protein
VIKFFTPATGDDEDVISHERAIWGLSSDDCIWLHHGLDEEFLTKVTLHECYHCFQKAMGRPVDEPSACKYSEGFMKRTKVKQLGLFTKPFDPARKPLPSYPGSGLYTKAEAVSSPKITILKIARKGHRYVVEKSDE